MTRLRVDPFKTQKEPKFPKDIEHIWNLLTKSEVVTKSPMEGKYICADYVLEIKNFLDKEYNIFSTIATVSSSNQEHPHAVIAVPSYERREWFFFDWNARPLTLTELMEIWDELIILRPGVNEKKFLHYPPSQKHIWYQYPPGLFKPPLREVVDAFIHVFVSRGSIYFWWFEYLLQRKVKIFVKEKRCSQGEEGIKK